MNNTTCRECHRSDKHKMGCSQNPHKRLILPMTSVSHDIAVIAETLGDEQELYNQYAERIAAREAREVREAYAEQGILEFE